MALEPYKFTEAKRDEYLRALSEKGLSRGLAAKAVGVNRETVNDYIRDHPEFVELRDQAEMEANEQVENALFVAATQDRSVTAIQVWLYNRMPDRWRDQRNRELADNGQYAAVDQWVKHMTGGGES